MVLYPNKLPESERVCSGICIIEYKFNFLSLQQKDYLILGDKLRLGISNCTY